VSKEAASAGNGTGRSNPRSSRPAVINIEKIHIRLYHYRGRSTVVTNDAHSVNGDNASADLSQRQLSTVLKDQIGMTR